MRFVLSLRIALGALALASLAACSASTPLPAAPREYWPAEARASHAPSDVWRLRFRAERPDDVASLADGAGTRLCTLPCTALVPPMAGYTVRIATSSGSSRTLDIPTTLDEVALGESATVIARPKRGHPGAARTLVISGALLIGFGTLFLGAGLGGHGQGESVWGLLYGVGMTGIGFPMMIGGFIWGSASQPASLDVIAQ